MKPADKLVLVAGVLNLSTAPTSAIWRVLGQQLRLEVGELIEVARSPSARVDLRYGVRNRSRITSLCALLDAILRRIFRLRKYPFMGLFYRVLLSQGPSVVLTIGAHPALCREAKRRGVPVVELEHAPGGGGSLDLFRDRPPLDVPDAYIVFDDVAYEIACRVLSERMTVFRARCPLPNRSYRSSIPFNMDHRIVLVALQWGKFVSPGMVVKYPRHEVIPGVIREAIERGGDSVSWRLRPHPRQMYDKQYRYQLKEVFDFARSNKNVSVDPLHDSISEVVRECDVLVTAFSSSSVEAAQNGVPSIFVESQLNSIDEIKVGALLSAGFATKCDSDSGELLEKIHLSRRFDCVEDASRTVSDILREIGLS